MNGDGPNDSPYEMLARYDQSKTKCDTPGGGGPPGGGGNPPLNTGQQAQPQPPQSSGRFIGEEPQTFTGDRTKADEFFTQWNLFVGVNYSNLAMTNVFSRSMLFLTYMQGPHINEWVLQQR
jgi:hypothetical protein